MWVYTYNEPRSRTVMWWRMPALSGTISKVTLGLYQFDQDGSGNISVTAHGLTNSFNESYVTWNARTSTLNWTNRGGDYSPTVIDRTSVPVGTYGWYNWTLYGEGSESNLSVGWNSTLWLMLQSENRKIAVPYFYSKEAPSNKPVLYIEYSP